MERTGRHKDWPRVKSKGAGRLASIVVAFVLLSTWLNAVAQPPAKVPRVGFLTAFSPSDHPLWRQAFRQGLQDLGYTEGQNIVVVDALLILDDFFLASHSAQLAALAAKSRLPAMAGVDKFPEAGVAGQGGHADEGRDLFAGERAEFGQIAEQGAADDGTDAGDRAQKILLGAPDRTGLDGPIQVVIDVVKLALEPADLLSASWLLYQPRPELKIQGS